MRQLLFALLGASAFVGAAHAGDLPSDKAPAAPPPVVVTYDWTGFYAGLHAGGAFGQTDFALPASGYSHSFGSSGVFGGAHAGYIYQVQSIVLGAESEFSALGDRNAFTDSNLSVSAHHDWFGSVGGRLGYAYKNYLVYAAGGYAFANENSAVQVNSVNVGQIGTSLNGYDIGGGVEYAFTPNWSGQFEYRHYQFDSRTAQYSTGTTLFTEKPYYDTFRLGFSYHWVKEPAPAPVVAKF